MTTRLCIWLDTDKVGWLSHEPETNRFSFEYLPEWVQSPHGFALSPQIPLVRSPGRSADDESARVRQFFENLLPEGEALDHAAQANGLSKANLMGLMAALGRETAGAIRIARFGGSHDPQLHGARLGEAEVGPSLRLVTPEELSHRIRERNHIPFSVWDGKVRLSIAGYQDKIAVYEREGRWFLVEGGDLASTVIVKPVPQRPQLADLPAIEFVCMQLAARVGLPVAETRLVHVPEPVLLVRRFDRLELNGRVRRLHLLDACQALGVSVSMKYERPYGDGPDVRNIRDGVSYARLFQVVESSIRPAADRLALLRWVIFQVLIGNSDAHGKNVSFFSARDGLRLAPAYDLVSIAALDDDKVDRSFAMAIGDAFTEAEITPFEWALFAHACKLPQKMVSTEIRRMATRILEQLPVALDAARSAGVSEDILARVTGVIAPACRRHAGMAAEVARIDNDLLT